MRGSAVFNSIKSWVSKLHPPLPLSQKESQRLLTALTASFRHQLDQSHPQRPGGEKPTPPNGPTPSSKGAANQLHASSAHAADQHMASVLTNPLLTKTTGPQRHVLNYATAEKCLLEDPSQDTLSLLEKYHESSVATCDIAALCLETFRQQLDKLSSDERSRVVAQQQAGRRTFNWLLESRNHDTADFVDNRRLSKAMVVMLVEEGREELLWEWMQQNVHLGPQEPTEHQLKLWGRKLNHKMAWFRERWKERLVVNIIDAKLELNANNSADEAIDVVVRSRDSGINALPPAQHLARIYSRSYSRLENDSTWLKADPSKFDRLVGIMAKYHPSKAHLLDTAILACNHPTQPSALPLYNILQETSKSNTSGKGPTFAERLKSHNKEANQEFYYRAILNAIARLKVDQFTAQAKSLQSLLSSIYPEKQRFIEGDIDSKSSTLEIRSQRRAQDQGAPTFSRESRRYHDIVTLPTFT